MEELEKINEDPEFHHYMTHEEDMRKRNNTRMKLATEKGLAKGLARGLAKGMKQGMEQGRINATSSIAKAMKESGEEIEIISKYTGLSKEEIKNL